MLKKVTALRKAVTKQKEKPVKVQAYKLNPKSISLNYLYGYADRATNEWKDGIAA